MEQKKDKSEFNEYDIERLKWCMNLPAAKKLEYLEELNKFLRTAAPEENKKIWEKLKKMGW